MSYLHLAAAAVLLIAAGAALKGAARPTRKRRTYTPRKDVAS
ncbi:hypothetical protein [Streptomyces sp. NPDC050560]